MYVYIVCMYNYEIEFVTCVFLKIFSDKGRMNSGTGVLYYFFSSCSLNLFLSLFENNFSLSNDTTNSERERMTLLVFSF